MKLRPSFQHPTLNKAGLSTPSWRTSNVGLEHYLYVPVVSPCGLHGITNIPPSADDEDNHHQRSVEYVNRPLVREEICIGYVTLAFFPIKASEVYSRPMAYSTTLNKFLTVMKILTIYSICKYASQSNDLNVHALSS